ncbi:response regulator transcription factor [Streptomyces sp. SID8352]|uniref:LuxR C-terminal-related transcriptional regulator n=1 Tax=Streptomyces sp. SID8352 TaxID=2690338 RepID=UPI00136B07B0|nr:DNA-binding response regulator [Streptomyces sp. SID8352]
MSVLGSEPLERAGVRRALEEDGRARVVGEMAAATPHLLRTHRPDVLVSSHGRPEQALDVLRLSRASAAPGPAGVPAPAHVVLTSGLSEHSTRMLLRHGARGILLRRHAMRHLPWAVRAAAAGTVALGPAAARFLVDQYVHPGHTADAVAAARTLLDRLSSREHEIVRLLAEGASNPGVARTLGISPHTVKDHIRGVYAKLGVDNRVQASRVVWQAQVPARPSSRAPW